MRTKNCAIKSQKDVVAQQVSANLIACTKIRQPPKVNAMEIALFVVEALHLAVSVYLVVKGR